MSLIKNSLFIDKKFLLYIGSGLTAFMVEFGIFNLLDLKTGLNLVVVNSISFLFGLVTSYTLNEKIVFNNRDFALKSRARKGSYLLLASINIVLTNVLISLFVSAGMSNYIAKLFVMGSVVLWNYLIFSKLIFKSQSK